MNVGAHYNYTTEDHSEYLLIVSKEYDANDQLNEKQSSDKRKVSTVVFFCFVELGFYTYIYR